MVNLGTGVTSININQNALKVYVLMEGLAMSLQVVLCFCLCLQYPMRLVLLATEFTQGYMLKCQIKKKNHENHVRNFLQLLVTEF